MIRSMRPEDRSDYLDMTHEFHHSSAVLHPTPRAYRERTFDHIVGGSPFVRGYILEEEEGPAGYGIVVFSYSTERGGMILWVEELYVRSAFQGRGLGTGFFRYLKEEFGTLPKGYRLEVAPDNEGAARLYQRLGYRDVQYRQLFAPDIFPAG
ncbi:GNAT family N-acetyltransferase [Christensenella sp. MSJ-20]|uniref:GNAT family N-acetyltransferase n=1 Tax=Christensenella sp. MSJ-20 TaxID=2841518 RepID=UPI000D7A2AFD|nr:MAG: N-acetyltransferase [Bacillota bacterium]QWT54630.1 GNAT family N-acetyltransferase [Christensenella sp. MSJ-20]